MPFRTPLRRRRCRVCKDLAAAVPRGRAEDRAYDIPFRQCYEKAPRCDTCRLIISVITSPVMRDYLKSFHLDFERCVQAYGDENLLINVSTEVNGRHKDQSLTLSLTPDDSFLFVGGPILPFNTVPFPPIEIYSQDRQSQWPAIGRGGRIFPNGASPEVIGLITSWLEECRDKHKDCPPMVEKRLPDRVLCVSNGDRIYLDTNASAKHGHYVALSHRWGDTPMSLQLKESNLAAFRRGIPFSRFPKNFRHAINICRLLEIDYLWIDSLCIIQDSDEDKQEKFSKMAETYSDCLFSIAADAGKDSEAGFLRTPGRLEAAENTWELVAKNEVFYIRRSCIDTFQISVHGGKTSVCHSWSKPVDGQSPLSLRGWVLQETMLAPRTLHFCADELVWECKTHSRCECTHAPHIVEDSKFSDPYYDSDFDDSSDADEWPSKWADIVSEFTFRTLTKKTDRLNALAGIAKQQLVYLEKEERLSTKYISGLWRHNLREGLHWHRVQEGFTPRFTKTSRRWGDDTSEPDVDCHRMPTYLYSSDDSSDTSFDDSSDNSSGDGHDHISSNRATASGRAGAVVLARQNQSGGGGTGNTPSERMEGEDYIAPSWSWASITGRVRLNPWTQSDRDNMEEFGVYPDELARILSLDFRPKNRVNKFGAAAEGTSLTVEAETFRVRVLPRKRRDGTERWKLRSGGLEKGTTRFLADFCDVRNNGVDYDSFGYHSDHHCHLDTDEEEEAVTRCNGRSTLTAVNLSNYTTFIILREEEVGRQGGGGSGRTRVYKRVGIIGAFRSRPPVYKYQGHGQRRRIRII